MRWHHRAMSHGRRIPRRIRAPWFVAALVAFAAAPAWGAQAGKSPQSLLGPSASGFS